MGYCISRSVYIEFRPKAYLRDLSLQNAVVLLVSPTQLSYTDQHALCRNLYFLFALDEHFVLSTST